MGVNIGGEMGVKSLGIKLGLESEKFRGAQIWG